MKRLCIHKDKKYLMLEDGTPFFYLADTAWELFHRLNQEEAQLYLKTRAKQGFNVIQAVALAECDGLNTPNAYGRTPLLKTNGRFDPEKPDTEGEYSYWSHVDNIINIAEENGLYIALLPTWGDKYFARHGIGPEIFNAENAYTYGRWIANRYKDHNNIIWVLGGDRSLETQNHREVIDAMGKAIKDCDEKNLITFHPMGERSSVDDVSGKDYIDFHAVQSCHGVKCYQAYRLLRYTKEKEEKPFLDMEPRYEDHPACFCADYRYYWDADDVRQNAYWALMEGVCGHTYGNHCVWSMNTEPTDYFPYKWNEVLMHDGACQMKFVKELRMKRPFFELRPAPELIKDDTADTAHQCAARGKKYAYVYSPLGLPVRFYTDRLCVGPVKAAWFDPRNGEETVFGIYDSKENLFVPPSTGKGNDWILIIDVLE